MTQYSLLACDMDGTLLADDASICQRNINTIKEAISKGLHFVPCTGRGFESLDTVQKALGVYGKAREYVISYNGGLITETRTTPSSTNARFPCLLHRRSMTMASPTILPCMSTYMATYTYITMFPLNENFWKGAWQIQKLLKHHWISFKAVLYIKLSI